MASLLKDQAARTTSRRQLERRHDDLEGVSAAVGLLDESALAARAQADPDRALALLADLGRATDRLLRQQARALAPRLLLPLTREGRRPAASGTVKLVRSKQAGLELDIDATIEEIAGREAPAAEDLRWLRWQRPGRAYILVVDASGSVTGQPLATALVTAAALIGRLAPHDELAVVAFWSKTVVLRAITSLQPPLDVLDALFDLRGGDTTDLAGGLRAGLAQATRAGVGRRDLLILTDGVATAGDDPVPVAATAAADGAAVHVLALTDDAQSVASGHAIADAGGGRLAPLLRPSDAPRSIAAVLGGTL